MFKPETWRTKKKTKIKFCFCYFDFEKKNCYKKKCGGGGGGEGLFLNKNFLSNRFEPLMFGFNFTPITT